MAHHGHNIKRIREILGIKQGTLATEFKISQQAISDLEKKSQINDDVLKKVATALNVSVNTIKNFNEETIVLLIKNIFNE